VKLPVDASAVHRISKQAVSTGLAALAQIEPHPTLVHYHLLPAKLGELFSELGQQEKAAQYYKSALDCVCTEPERRLYKKRLSQNVY
jgi:predicted RNA polymerase sigma factor